MKLWERVIETRIRRETQVTVNQFGFMPGRSTTEAIHILRRLMEKYREKRDLHMVFIDLGKAYDNVPRRLIWDSLESRRVPGRYIDIIKDMYDRTKTTVRAPVEDTDFFPVEVGLHQGSATSRKSTLNGKLLEVVDALKRRRVQIACLQETRWKGQRGDERNGYKLNYSGSDGAKNGVGFLVALEVYKNVVEVIRYNDRVMVLRLVLGEEVVAVVCAYAPHVGLGDREKTEFWDRLDIVVRAIPRKEKIFIGGDFNGHIGEESDGFQSVHGGFGFGVRNDPGRDLLEFLVAHDLSILNSFFRKRDSHLITFSSGGHHTQIDYLLTRREDRRWWQDCKVIPRETAAAQHHLLVADITFRQKLIVGGRKCLPRIRWGNLKGVKIGEFKDKIVLVTSTQLGDDANQMWEAMATTITQVAKETLGVTTGRSSGHKESWWWNDEVQTKIKDKQESFRDLLKCTDEEKRLRLREGYKKAKKEAKKTVMEAKNTAYMRMYESLETKEGEHAMFKISKARERRRHDLGRVNFIKGEDRRILYKEIDIKLKWQTYFHNLFNEERTYQQQNINNTTQKRQRNNCYCRNITHGEARTALRKMGRAKAVGIDNERVIETIEEKPKLRLVSCQGDQTTKAIHILRRLMEKYREKKRDLHMVFIDLEKAYDNVPRRPIWDSLGSRGVPGRYIDIIRDMYDRTKTTVRAPVGDTDFFPV
ncbi:uncharacterized protein LOC143628907 [Bidens hawaiensis]|uniref:uncharacterized protein LOC143628907 n=1 Tax=Bidens hawaiensis TaxID=980011 RepID=UPI00404B59AC